MWQQQLGAKSLHVILGVTFLLVSFLAVDILFLFNDGNDVDNLRERAVHAAIEAVKLHRESLCKRKQPDNGDADGNEQPKKKKYVRYNRERANQCVMQDYLGPNPTFDDRQFERVFCITRQMYERIRRICCTTDSLFTTGVDCTGHHAIYTDVKILAALKKMAYGVSSSAFIDYFQMGELMAELCCKKVAHAISHCRELWERYLRIPTREDARRISLLHQLVHGVVGMLRSLDCMHVPWKNCPVAYQGQYTNGKQGHPTIILEAVADYNLWFWHVAFGFPGSYNDINVWDNSPLHKAFVDGTFSLIDFEFEIAGKVFNKLWFLVDGIYPELARFVKTIAVPCGRMMNRFAAWQEAA